ncbi:hypothetical protein [Halosolutus gelatinilyticus]|uniref:hypothetical protein n=1 Tax=Halosolutus gelatinilyticus TaxID=2931975 RepID=UPI001FF67188|nr:hypothetical protein [Halosolutus gelatinilyticus]
MGESRYLRSVLLTAIVGSLAGATILRSRIQMDRYRSAEVAVWDEVVRYAVTFFPVVTGTALVLGAVTAVVSDAAEAPLLVRHVLATVLTAALLALRCRGRITYPSWLRNYSWGLSAYAILFGGVFFTTYIYLTPVFGPTDELLTLFSLACATIAVLLRRTEVFVPSCERPAICSIL